MGAANGFVTTAPDARWGANEFTSAANQARCQKFVCGGTGPQSAVSIGCYMRDSGDKFILAIFTHDATNNCPDVIVANSVTSELTAPLAITTQSLYTYATKPALNGGATYWIALLSASDVSLAYDTGAPVTSGETLYKNSVTYPTFVEGDSWHTHIDSTANTSLFVVYEAAATAQYARPASDVADGNWLNESSNNTNLYASIDEASASDSDYIRSGTTPVDDTCTVGLSSISTPDAGTVTMRIRARFL